MSEQNPLKMKLSSESGQYYKVENNELTGYANESEGPSPMAKEIYTRLLKITPSDTGLITDISQIIKQEKYTLGIYDELASDISTMGLERDLNIFINQYSPRSGVSTFIAGFRFPGDLSEAGFRDLLKTQINLLTDTKELQTDPENSLVYTFKFNRVSFSVWGMHSNSSAKETRFEYPLLIIKYHST